MKTLIASVAAAALIATPVLAAPTATTTKTVTTKTPTAKATTTVTTKVTPVATKGKAHAQVKQRTHVTKVSMKKSTSAKSAGTKKS